MQNVMRQEKLSLNDFENLNATNAPFGHIPDWLCGKKSISPVVLRLMMFLFFLTVGYVATATGMDPATYPKKNFIASIVSVSNFLLGFFLNQIFFVPRFFFKRRFKTFIFANFLFLIESAALQSFFIFWLNGKTGPLYESLFGNASIPNTVWILLIFLVLTIIVCAFNVLFRLGGIHAQEAYVKRIQENFYLQANLAFLKQQLSSHFLFNTLNNITALVDIDPKLAQKSMIRLSSVLRQMLHETKEKNVPLEMELDILQKYLELEKLRFGPNVQFSFDADIDEPSKRVAPLLMIPLVENAIKYGVHPSDPCKIQISIEEKDDSLHCHVENTIAPQTASTRVKSGIGLANLKRRLEVCYPGKYRYEANESEGIYVADLQVSLQKI